VERREDSRYPVEASEIEFLVDDRIHKAYGPPNYEYEQGRTLRIFYARNDPSINFVASFSGFYLSGYSILPLILITVWYAFYLSFNNYHKRMKMPKGRPVNPSQASGTGTGRGTGTGIGIKTATGTFQGLKPGAGRKIPGRDRAR
jgi:hypothetical protein